MNSANVVIKNYKLKRNYFEKETPDSILISGKKRYREEMVSIEIQLQYKNIFESFETEVRIQNEHFIY
jgi:hypothetical protein